MVRTGMVANGNGDYLGKGLPQLNSERALRQRAEYMIPVQLVDHAGLEMHNRDYKLVTGEMASVDT